MWGEEAGVEGFWVLLGPEVALACGVAGALLFRLPHTHLGGSQFHTSKETATLDLQLAKGQRKSTIASEKETTQVVTTWFMGKKAHQHKKLHS